MQLKESEEWTTSVYIVKHHNGHSNRKKYTARNTFKTKEEAENYCIIFAKQIIDGVNQDLSVEDL